MSRIPAAVAAAVQVALCACAAPASAPEAPALLVAPDAQAREELRRAVSTALNGAPVVLADDALNRTSELIIERTPARDASGRLLSGREFGMPEHFHLVASDTRCTLVHDASGQRFVLSMATCKPAP